MSIASSPPEEPDEVQGPGLPKPIRLSEVGQIAAERLEGGANGSLKEALALRDPPTTAEDGPADLAEPGPVGPRIEETASQPESRPETAADETRPIDAAAPGGPVEPAAGVEASETTPDVPASASADNASQVVAATGTEERGVQSPEFASFAAGDGAEAPSTLPLSPAAQTVDTWSQLPATEPEAQPPGPTSDAVAAGQAAAAASSAFIAPPLFTAEPTPAVQSFGDAQGATYPPETAAEVGDGRAEPSSDAPSPIAHGAIPLAVDPKFAGAFGAAARLAADATAAAEAIENLKRMLEQQLPQSGETLRPPLHELFGEAAAAAAPPPLPQHEPILGPEEGEPRGASAKPLPRPASREAAWRERRQFDVRGFMAGFALSWAIGAALYIYLTAG
jgi:hypothetical protein